MAGNFRGKFHYLRGWLGSNGNFHSQQLMTIYTQTAHALRSHEIKSEGPEIGPPLYIGQNSFPDGVYLNL